MSPKPARKTNGAENYGGVGDHSSMGADGVLVFGNRDHAGTAGEADRRLDTNHTVVVGGADDTAVGFGAEGSCSEIR